MGACSAAPPSTATSTVLSASLLAVQQHENVTSVGRQALQLALTNEACQEHHTENRPAPHARAPLMLWGAAQLACPRHAYGMSTGDVQTASRHTCVHVRFACATVHACALDARMHACICGRRGSVDSGRGLWHDGILIARECSSKGRCQHGPLPGAFTARCLCRHGLLQLNCAREQ